MIQPTSRRAVLGALAATPAIGLPQIADAASPSCPALAAVTEYRRLQAIENAAWEATDAAHDIGERRRDAVGFVEIAGKQLRTVRELDEIFGVSERRTLTVEELEETIATMRANVAAQKEPEPLPAEYHDARAKLIEIEARFREQDVFAEYAESEEAATEASHAADDAMLTALQSPVASAAGAIAVLRVAADFLEKLGINDRMMEADFVPAMRRAIDRLEGDA